jgi:hypothetical protein
MKTILTMISAGLLFIATSCNKSQDVQPAADNSTISSTSSTDDNSGRPTLATYNLVAEQINQRVVYFSNLQYAVQMKLYGNVVPGTSLPISFNRTNTMYLIKESVADGSRSRFLPVLDKLPVTNFTSGALWQVVVLSFNETLTKPWQLTSSKDIQLYLSMPNSGIRATKTNSFFQMQMAPLADQPAATQ